MKDKKRYKKIINALLLIIFFPLVILIIVMTAITILFETPIDKKNIKAPGIIRI